MITIVAPTVETEIEREKQAFGKWRLWDGVAWKGNYESRQEAEQKARRFGGRFIGFCGKDRYEVVNIG